MGAKYTLPNDMPDMPGITNTDVGGNANYHSVDTSQVHPLIRR